MKNLCQPPISDKFIIENDTGYWIPLLTDRQTVVPPMAFTVERVNDPENPDNLRKLEGLNGQLTTDEGLKLLAKEGVDYVYVGAQGGTINPEELLKSPYFRVVYEEGSVYIFEVLELPTSVKEMEGTDILNLMGNQFAPVIISGEMDITSCIQDKS